MLQSDFSQIKILKKIFSKTEFNKRVHIFFTNKITTKCPQKNRTKISRTNHNYHNIFFENIQITTKYAKILTSEIHTKVSRARNHQKAKHQETKKNCLPA